MDRQPNYELRFFTNKIEIYSIDDKEHIIVKNMVKDNYLLTVAENFLQLIIQQPESICPTHATILQISIYLKILNSENFIIYLLYKEKSKLFNMLTYLKDIEREIELFLFCMQLKIFPKREAQDHIIKRMNTVDFDD